MNLRRWGVGLSALGALALIGAGVGASYSDSGTATETQHVGTFACTLTSTDPDAVISPDGHSVTVTQGPILSSASSSFPYSNFTIHNSGTIPTFVSWNVTTSGTIVWEPARTYRVYGGNAVERGEHRPCFGPARKRRSADLHERRVLVGDADQRRPWNFGFRVLPRYVR